MDKFDVGSKALWRGNIPVVIVDGYEGMPHKRTIKMDVDGDVFHWDVKTEELSTAIDNQDIDAVADAWQQVDILGGANFDTAPILTDAQINALRKLALAVEDMLFPETKATRAQSS